MSTLLKMSATLVAGVAVGFLVAGTRRAERVLEPQRAPTRATEILCRGSDLSARELRALREELRAAVTARADVAVEDPPARTPPEPAVSREALAEGHRIIEQAIAAGRWVEDDSTALRARLGELGPEEAGEVMRRFMVSANSGTIRIETEGPPL